MLQDIKLNNTDILLGYYDIQFRIKSPIRVIISVTTHT